MVRRLAAVTMEAFLGRMAYNGTRAGKAGPYLVDQRISMSIQSIVVRAALVATCLLPCAVSDSAADDKKPVIVKRSFEGWQVEYLQNSPTVSQALGMDASGALFGFKEKQPFNSRVYFYYDQDGEKEFPLPKGYTDVDLAAISHSHLIVGRVTKSFGSHGGLQAIVWSPDKGEVKLLPTPDGDTIADACDITEDGQRITGYATGPGRLRPVVWDWDQAKGEWKVEVLETLHDNNPYLMSSQLVVAPNGDSIVGCCTEKFLEEARSTVRCSTGARLMASGRVNV